MNEWHRNKRRLTFSTSLARGPSRFVRAARTWENARTNRGRLENTHARARTRTRTSAGAAWFFNKNDYELQRSVMLFITEETALCTDPQPHLLHVQEGGPSRPAVLSSPSSSVSLWLLRHRPREMATSGAMQMNVKWPPLRQTKAPSWK